MTKIVFFGTPNYVLPLLKELDKNFKVVGVVTQPPKIAGRGKKFKTFSPVDNYSHKKKIPVFYKADDLIANNIEADLGILESYGEILSNQVIEMFPHGILNAHPSLLPKFRGASPVQAALLMGEKQTGVTIIKLDEKLDHGPIVSFFKENVSDSDTTDSLRERLFERSIKVLIGLIPSYLSGKINLQKQDDEKATFTSRITKTQGFIPPFYLNEALKGKTFNKDWKIDFMKDFSISPTPHLIERFIRAMHSSPGAWTNIQIQEKPQRLKIIKSRLEDEKLVLDEVQLEGKNKVSWQQFKQGYPNSHF